MSAGVVWNPHTQRHERLYRPCPNCRRYNITVVNIIAGKPQRKERACFACGHRDIVASDGRESDAK